MFVSKLNAIMNYGNKHARSRSDSVRCWNPEGDRAGTKDGQERKKVPNDR